MSVPNDRQAPGTKIRVSITGGRVRDRDFAEPPLESLTPVSGGSNHFLYLTSPSVTGNKRAGGTVTAAFDAVITGPAGGGNLATTKVAEVAGNGTGLTHYVFLSGPDVTLLPDDEPPVTIDAGRTSEPETATGKKAGMTGTRVTSFGQLRPGDRVTVEAFTGEAVRNPYGYPLDGLVKLRDPETSNVHWFPAELLTRATPPAPFKDGVQYTDAEGAIYTFSADMGGRWQVYPNADDYYNFSYPPRPMREVTVGAEISE